MVQEQDNRAGRTIGAWLISLGGGTAQRFSSSHYIWSLMSNIIEYPQRTDGRGLNEPADSDILPMREATIITTYTRDLR